MFSIEYIRALNSRQAAEYIKERRQAKRQAREPKKEKYNFIGRLMPING